MCDFDVDFIWRDQHPPTQRTSQIVIIIQWNVGVIEQFNGMHVFMRSL